jgi:hypothetical protein
MKQSVSFILIFSLVFQIPSSLFAQANVQSEVVRLQRCINEKFQIVNQELTEIEGTPIELDSDARLMYSRYILEGLMQSFDSELLFHTEDAKKYAQFYLAGMLSTVISASKIKKAKTILNELKQENLILRLDGGKLAGAGGEASLAAEEKFYRRAVRNTKFFTGALGVFTAVMALYAGHALWNMLSMKSDFYNAEEDLILLKYANSEYLFFKALRSESELVSKLRSESLMTCRAMEDQDFKKIMKDLLSSSKQERENAYQQARAVLLQE